MKGVILHGGAGTRLRPLTFSGPKQLIPVANKPISQYVLEDLVSVGIRDVAIVLGETFPELVKEHYGDGSRFNVNITYIYQGKPLGIAHAVGLCKDFVGDEPFIVYLGDNLLQNGIKMYVEKFLNGSYDAYVLLKEVEDPTRFGVARFNEKGILVGFIEKPKIPPSNYAIIGVYFFKPLVFDVIRELKPSWRGELEITDTLQLLLEKGYRIGYSIVDGWWLDTGKKDDIIYANMLILDERAKREVKGEIINSKIEGRVIIENKSKIIDSVVRGPAIIGENCIVEKSFVGPYTSIGKNSRIINSFIENSVILENSMIKDIEKLEDSLIGKNARITRSIGRSILKINVGDYSEIEI